jgi:DNA-binding MarR family transcriptional regulator
MSKLSIDPTSVKKAVNETEKNWSRAKVPIAPQILKIYRIGGHFKNDVAMHVKDLGLQSSDFGVLATLRRTEFPHVLSPTDLCNALMFSSGGLTKVLARLEKGGFIERVANHSDKRSKLVQLTGSGLDTVDRLSYSIHVHETKNLSVLTSDEQNTLDSLLGKLLTSWE